MFSYGNHGSHQDQTNPMPSHMPAEPSSTMKSSERSEYYQRDQDEEQDSESMIYRGDKSQASHERYEGEMNLLGKGPLFDDNRMSPQPTADRAQVNGHMRSGQSSGRQDGNQVVW